MKVRVAGARRRDERAHFEVVGDRFDCPAWFESYGAVSLRSLVHYLCSHDRQHLAGLQWLPGQIEAARSRPPG